MSDSVQSTYCSNHPQTETNLRCNNCEKPICSKCAIKTPTGYRCPECVRGQQKIFETALWTDYLVTFLIVGFFSLLGGWLTTFVTRLSPLLAGFIILFLAPTYAIAVAEIVRKAINRRRSLKLFKIASIAAVVGILPFLLIILVNVLIGFGSLWSLFPLVWQILYAFTYITTVSYRLKGIRI